MATKVKFIIKRFDPELHKDPYWQGYTLDVEDGMTVLEALLKISTTEDPTLTFRRSCRSAICGSCAMTINGYPRLACNTQVMEEFRRKGEVVIEPLKNYTVLKDLMVDMTPFWNKMERITPYLVPSKEPEDGWKITKEDEKKIDRAQRCIMCGSCNSVCNTQAVDQHFTGPSALAKAWRFVGDVREKEKRERLLRLSNEHGMWDCTRCIHCTEYCPKGVEPLEAIERLREKAMTEGIDDNPGARHVMALVDSVRRVGRLDEAAMTFKTLGFLRSIGMIPFGLKMEIHGKMPHPILFPVIENIEEVRKIYKKVTEEEED